MAPRVVTQRARHARDHASAGHARDHAGASKAPASEVLPASVVLQSRDVSLPRCPWAQSEMMVRYHDQEWGVPVHDDRLLFEFLILEGAQAGLSWSTVLRKRERYREVFAEFDPARVARFDSRKVRKLLADPGIIRNRLKIRATIGNARAFLAVQEEFAGFDAYVWRFTGGAPKQNAWPAMKNVPCRSAESDALSKDLQTRGFRFVGTTICYAFMQAVGMVNDHVQECFRHAELSSSSRS